MDKKNNDKPMRSASLKGETEEVIIAAQDQSLATNNYRKVIKGRINPKSRLCHENDENIEHIKPGFSELAKREYLERHNKVLVYMHWKIFKH